MTSTTAPTRRCSDLKPGNLILMMKQRWILTPGTVDLTYRLEGSLIIGYERPEPTVIPSLRKATLITLEHDEGGIPVIRTKKIMLEHEVPVIP